MALRGLEKEKEEEGGEDEEEGKQFIWVCSATACCE